MAKVFKMLQSFITNAQDVFAQEGYKKGYLCVEI